MKITPIAALDSNYIWCVQQNRHCVIVDPGEAAPVLAYLERTGLQLLAIVITHRHHDHIGGLDALVARHPCPVYGPDSPQIPCITQTLSAGESVTLLGCQWQVLAVPGHTEEHIAYFLPAAPLALTPAPLAALKIGAAGASTADIASPTYPVCFVGDSLFAGGCGNRLLGAEIMYASLQRLAALPATTWIYCGHEYTLTNLRFAQQIEPGNSAIAARLARVAQLRAANCPSLPSQLREELATNPFLRVDEPQVITKIHQLAPDLTQDSSAERFAVLRRAKDNFR